MIWAKVLLMDIKIDFKIKLAEKMFRSSTSKHFLFIVV